MLCKIKMNPAEKVKMAYVVLAAVTLAVFWQVSQFGFINLDDPVYVIKNHPIHSGITWESIRWALSTTHAEFWHPLTWISLMLDYQLFGLNAGGYHMTNLIFHIMSAMLLFCLFHRLTGAIGKSTFVAAFFAFHPLHVESVAWIAERKDVLSAFFWMLTLCLYVYYTKNQNIQRYLLVVFSFALGLMSKSSIITLPFVMMLLDYWPLHRFSLEKSYLNFFKRQFREKAIFLLLTFVFVLITVWVQPSVHHFPWPKRMANAVVSFFIYLQKAFFPVDLTVFYPFPESIPAWKVIGALGLLMITTMSALMMRKRHPYFFVGWFWYCITILPFLGIMQVGNHAMADRYTYLSLTGVGIILAWGVPPFFRNNSAKRILRIGVVLFLMMMAFLSWRQCGYWKNDKTLFHHALSVTSDNYMAHICLGVALENEGQIQQAIEHCQEAIRIKPAYANSFNCRGSVYYRIGQYEKALQDCRQAIRVQPDYAESYYYAGLTYHQLKKYRLALKSLEKALSLTSDRADFHVAKGNSHFAIKEYQKALDEYDRAIRLKPDYAEAFLNRGMIALVRENRSSGCADLRKSCDLGLCRGLKWARENHYCLSANK